MKFRLTHLIDVEAMRLITDAVLRADLGSRINFEPEEQLVRVENWLSVEQTLAAITGCGVAVAAVLDPSNEMRRY
jgi:hypothetical protein